MFNNDGSFYIEIATAKALTSGPGQMLLEEDVMKQLPSETVHLSINSSTMKMSNLRDSDLARFCSIEAQGKIDEILQQLCAVQRGHCPCFTAWAGDALLVKARRPLSCSFITATTLVMLQFQRSEENHWPNNLWTNNEPLLS